MRIVGAMLAAGLCLAGAFACSRNPPPAGRWEGTYESADTLVAVRLEIDSKSRIFLTAPDAMNVAGMSADDRQAVRKRLAEGLGAAWSAVEPRDLDFDGRIFRKPGGVAPQLEWNPDQKQMTAVIYLGVRPSIRIPLHAVTQFSDDPWTG